ncbi:MAG: NADAR family protein [Myxococcota bacterium]
MNLSELRRRYDAGERPPLFFFYGHTPPADGRVGPHVFSQWWGAPFVVDGTFYSTAEHWMMAEKARLFGDDEALAAILASPTPSEAKRLGRTVRAFDDAVWKPQRQAIVRRGSVEKFGQDPALRAYLLATGDAVLVEASPSDTIWGIGLGASSPRAQDPNQWRGLNLLGFALMAARGVLGG